MIAQNINSFLSLTTRIASIEHEANSYDYKIHCLTEKDEKMTPFCVGGVKNRYQALQALTQNIAGDDITPEPVFFQLMDKVEMFRTLPSDQSLKEDFLVHVFPDGGVITLSLELNIPYSEHPCTSFVVDYLSRYGVRHCDEGAEIPGSETQFFQQTPKGLQMALNCFLDRIHSHDPGCASQLWSGMSALGTQTMTKLKNLPLNRDFLLGNGYEERPVAFDKQETAYTKKFQDGTATKYVVRIEYCYTAYSETGISGYWTMRAIMDSNPLGQGLSITVPLPPSATVLDLIEAQDTVEQMFQQLGCNYHSMN